MSTIQQIPRTSFRLGVAAARLPLTAAEVVTGRRGRDGWAPALAFEAAEARTEQMLGRVLHDDVLTSEGRLRLARVEKVREAVILEAEADARRRQAETTFEQRRDAAESDRTDVEQDEVERKVAIAREQADAERQADAEASQKAAAADAAKAKARRAAQRKSRQTKAEALRAEERAVETKKAATSRARAASAADRKVVASKAARRRPGG